MGFNNGFCKIMIFVKLRFFKGLFLFHVSFFLLRKFLKETFLNVNDHAESTYNSICIFSKVALVNVKGVVHPKMMK